jgi:ABC-type polysaccharide/polyol phosphate export permease
MDQVPETLAPLLYLNPMTSLIVSYRLILLEHGEPLFSHLLIMVLISIVLLYLALKLLFRYEKEYAKVI